MPRAGVLTVACLAAFLSALTAAEAAGPIPRAILALYDGRYEKEVRFLPVHQMAAMPLNHLGLVVRFHDIRTPLPSLESMQDVRGILTWFRSDSMSDPRGFLEWANRAIDGGKRFVVIGDIAAGYDLSRRPTPATALQAFWSRLGLRADDRWTTITYDWAIGRIDPRMVNFERRLLGVLPAFPGMRVIDDRVRSYLTVRRARDASTDADLVAVGPRGGYVAANYMFFWTAEDARLRQWYLNPFEFFREAFATDDLPKPDTTTVSGRRLFYSHVDGDGWRNITELTQYRRQRMTSAEVLLNEVIRRYPDFPVTVAPVAGDIDPAWYGNADALRVAREMLALPHVEAGSHTYGHPLQWEAFAERDAGPAADEGWSSWLSRRLFGALEVATPRRGGQPSGDGAYPNQRRSTGDELRTYNVKPFSLDLEITQSIGFINRLLPAGKRVEVLQWSGNTLPDEAAIAATRRAGVRNLNGGDTRFDPEFPSYAWVAPLGREVGKEEQVFASNSNENTYTDLWTERFFGFKYLTATLENTESPIRVKPHNIYYHVYSAEKLPSLTAVQENYRYASQQELTPVTASHFSAIVGGFFSARITEVTPRSWRIEQRGQLQTIRFDRADRLAVDYARSSGVVGHRLHQGSLYVALDADEPAAVITLTDAPAQGPFLVHARWVISHVQRSDAGFSFRAQGFGPGVAVWQAAPGTTYAVEVTPSGGAVVRRLITASDSGLLTMNLGPARPAEVRVVVRPN